DAEREADKRLRVKRLVRELATAFYTMDDCDFSGENPSPEYYAAKLKRDIFRAGYELIVTLLVEDGMKDFDIKDTIEHRQQVRSTGFASVVPEPWPDGAIRQYFTDWKDAVDAWVNIADGKTATLELAMDKRWCVTVTDTEEAQE